MHSLLLSLQSLTALIITLHLNKERAQNRDTVLLYSSVGGTHGERLHSALGSCLMCSWWLQWHIKAKFIYPNLWHVFTVFRKCGNFAAL